MPKNQIKNHSPSYLYIIGNTYYFRYRVPKRYRSYTLGSEIRINLYVHKLREARKLAMRLYVKVIEELEARAMPRAKNKSIPKVSLSDNISSPLFNVPSLAETKPREEPDFQACSEAAHNNFLANFDDLSQPYSYDSSLPITTTQLENLTSEEKGSVIAKRKTYYIGNTWEGMYRECDDLLNLPAKCEISFDELRLRLMGYIIYLLDKDTHDRTNRKAEGINIFAHNILPLEGGEDIEKNRENTSTKLEIYKNIVNDDNAVEHYLPAFIEIFIKTKLVRKSEVSWNNIYTVVNEYTKALVLYFQCLLERLDGNYYSGDEYKEKPHIAYPIDFKKWGTNISFPSQPKSQISSVQAQVAQSSSMLVSELIEKYKSSQLQDGKWQEHTKGDHLSRLNYLQFMLGDVPIDSINREKAREMRERIRKLPPRAMRDKIYADKTIDEIIAMKHKQYLSVKTVNVVIQAINSMFEWATREDYLLSQNPFKALSLKDERDVKDLVLPFASEELSLILSACKDRANENLARFWVPYISLYTAMRLEEICQLDIEDVKSMENDGIIYWYLEVKKGYGTDKKLKSKYAVRNIPLSQHLIDAGFLDYYKEQKNLSSQKLFPLLTKVASRDKYGHSVSQFFSRLLRDLGLKEKHNFHSLRHTFIEYCEKHRLRDANTTMFNELIGHSQDNLASRQYGAKYTVIECYERVISKIDFGVQINNYKNEVL